MVLRRRVLAGVTTALLLGSAGVVLAPAAVAATPVSLGLPAATAFTILGHSCGGIQEQSVATGFDPASGDPAGFVYLQTRCGSSGRGGGYHYTTYSAWVAVTWDFTGAVSSYAVASSAPTNLDPGLDVLDAGGDHLYNQLSAVNVPPQNCTPGNTTYCTYRAYFIVAAPGQPTQVAVSQSGDSLVVTWAAPASGGPASSLTVTADPGAAGSPLTTSVAGGATSAVIAGVAAATTYSVTVDATNAGGTGPASDAVSFTTEAASIVPSAPTGLKVVWKSRGTDLHATWTASAPGDSPIDDYQVEISRHDPAGPPNDRDAGTATTFDSPDFNKNFDWAVHVRAHNAAGWGAWSSSVILHAF